MVKSKQILFTLIFIFIFFTFMVLADSSKIREVARVDVDSNGLSVVINYNFKQMELSVSLPNGSVLTKNYDTNRSIYFSLMDIPANELSDGLYT